MAPGPRNPGPPAGATTALVSGGKDSIYAAYLAETQGWPVAELLVMEPSERDSWLFHTPNLHLVDLQGTAWSKPVRHVPVRGSTPEEETSALGTALSGRPGPVSVGAIASSFQWARVLKAADGCGRRVYAPLWRVDPGRVVREEIAAGLDIRLVQVAADGLSSEWLGERLSVDVLERIEQKAARGPAIHPAGEGGEFETVVVDAPFFASRIVIDAAQKVERGALAQWVVRRSHLEPKASRDGAVG